MGKITSFPLAIAPCRVTAAGPLKTTTPCISTLRCTSAQQIRHATMIPRARRPYTFTQLIQLSDGSTYTMRTTSPQALYRTTHDTRNTLFWQPRDKSLRNVELDEAGKLSSFRQRFGRGFDAFGEGGDQDGADGKAAPDVDFSSMISGYATKDTSAMRDRKKQNKK